MTYASIDMEKRDYSFIADGYGTWYMCYENYCGCFFKKIERNIPHDLVIPPLDIIMMNFLSFNKK